MASWGKIFANISHVALQDANTKILDSLHVNRSELNRIHEDFVDRVLGENSISIYTFQESRGLTGVYGVNGKVGALGDSYSTV
jgi:hypothetical protein